MAAVEGAAAFSSLLPTPLHSASGSPSSITLRSPPAALPVPGSRRRDGACALNMGIGDRFVRLFKANVNEFLNKAEDPEKMLNQIVEDMQKELIEFRQTYAEVAANTKRLEKQKQQADQLVEEWLKRAKLALEKGDEDAARAALERKNQQEETSNSLRAQLETQTVAVQNLFNQMQQLEQKISEAKAKKDQLKARAQTAKVSTKINDMMSRSSSAGALEAFNRMQDKVERMEAEAEVARELSGDSSMERRFKALESSSKVEDDLAALKGAIGGSSAPKSLSSSSLELDAELQKMKDEMKKN
ncbi:hypothetical protein GUITHDRAFT_150304 [Guillardia theta CCMP2712]|uniref:Phage shock protein A n=2 Tax=Guillardia theta TaxID=55529 RepID=L1JZ41_GUITC|nr:hypothetical protein GUITHDRAFT_150304 [Guillardia theta CCMP2712]EKX53821.1 hypothetical protein GUITHDRAFT_150304 [Guillardia theta CCMP2712]|eukprot:XP_005840801.1 hypothetical protein GUITHDRAFT_150304 [Guillardia theta CCMP2712]